NINAMSSGASDIGNLLLGMNAGSKASHAGRLLNTKQDAITEIQQNRLDELARLRDETRTTRQHKGDLRLQLLMQLQETGWNQYLQQQQLKMQQQQHRRALRGGGGGGGNRRPKRRGSGGSGGGRNYSGRSRTGGSGGGGSPKGSKFVADQYNQWLNDTLRG